MTRQSFVQTYGKDLLIFSYENSKKVSYSFQTYASADRVSVLELVDIR